MGRTPWTLRASAGVRQMGPLLLPPEHGWDYGVAWPTGRIELNESGQAAEVYEVMKDMIYT
ncbi:hypothetical protein GCM10023075_79950 [Streptosporangium album]